MGDINSIKSTEISRNNRNFGSEDTDLQKAKRRSKGKDLEQSVDETSSDDDVDSSTADEYAPAPVFISTAKRIKNANLKSSPSSLKTQEFSNKKEMALKQIEVNIQQDIDLLKQQSGIIQSFGGIDDTDGIDPESELEAWKSRNERRVERDNEKLLKEQEEFEELEMRRMAPEREKHTI